MSEAALSLVSVTKNFGGVRAVSNISMQVAPGERRVIIGPNGAGKTSPSIASAVHFKQQVGISNVLAKTLRTCRSQIGRKLAWDVRSKSPVFLQSLLLSRILLWPY